MFAPDDPIYVLVEHFSKLPGIGERTAMRLVLHLLQAPQNMHGLADAILSVSDKVRECERCAMLTAEKELCRICASSTRDKSVLCVVSSIQDLMAIESTHEYLGLFHVLHGVLEPMRGIGPNELRIQSLKDRLKENKSIQELIVATPPTVEGEATSLYLAEELKPFEINISRIASGVPVGGDLHFSDRLTLARSIALRREFS